MKVVILSVILGLCLNGCIISSNSQLPNSAYKVKIKRHKSEEYKRYYYGKGV